jgi:hypothetical protein
MANSLIQTSMFGGELSLNLYGTVDLAQYKKSVALARNMFVDYRGGLSTRFGTKYVLTALDSTNPVRLIPFTASFTVAYVMEFGQGYIRFHTNGGPVLEDGFTAGAFSGNTIVSAGQYNDGDWIYVQGSGGNADGNYYIITGVTAGATAYTVVDLFHNTPSLTGSGGTTSRVYTIQSPYAAADLALLKFAQNVQFMVFCHPNYATRLLTYNGPTNWQLTVVTYGATVPAPTGVSVTQSGDASGGWDTEYVVTAVDKNGQESVASSIVTLTNKDGIGYSIAAFANTITWTAVPGALYYNVYRAPVVSNASGPVPAGALFGLVASTKGTTYIESTNSQGQAPGTNITPDFSRTPPEGKNPFMGGSVTMVTVTARGGPYTSVPMVNLVGTTSGGTAIASVTLFLRTVAVTAGNAGSGYHVGQSVQFPNGVILVVASVSAISGAVTGWQALTAPGVNRGSVASGAPPATMGDIAKVGNPARTFVDVTWSIKQVDIIDGGTGYTTAPSVTFTPSVGTPPPAAFATLTTMDSVNPSVPCYFQQRLVLAAPTVAPQTLYFSIPGSPYNFNTHQITEPDDAITAVLVSKQLNSIKAMTPMPAGLIVATMSSAWLINGGGGPGSPVTAINITAQSQAYSGANDVPPIVANDDILYVQSKGAIVRDLRFNFYTSVYTGIDISVMAEHLFYGYQIKEWAWAEEPFKLVWAVRSDGILLSLTFSKEQEVYGWARHDTSGLFKSVASITESTPSGNVDATYVVVERIILGQFVQYIERLADRFMPGGLADTWMLDSALQYKGAPTNTFSGLAHLTNTNITALADGQVVTGLPVSSDGTITLPFSASTVLAGIPYVCQMQTLPVEAGQPTIQGKRKSVGPMTFKVRETRGLKVGRNPAVLVPVKDSGPPMLSAFPQFVFGDEWVVLDALYDTYGQIWFQQDNPWPATIMAVIPDINVGDSAR